jgi:ubiquinone/menaquinone biosynthesis C-methylase UbiE
VCGIDLSPRLVAAARRRYPEISFSVGDALALDDDAETFGAIVAFYSLIHLEPTDFRAALREIRRVLRPRGVLLAAFHRGSEPVHLDDWWGVPASIWISSSTSQTRFARPSLMRGSGSSG